MGLYVVLGDALTNVVHEAENILSCGIALLGERTQLANGRRVVASTIR